MLRPQTALICGLLLWESGARAAPPATGASAVGGAGERGSKIREDALEFLGSSATATTRANGRRLTGKFLHITDFHPDPFYKTYSSTAADAACHREHGPAGIYGAETSACDSPYALINQTFKWINDNVKDDIDFVIWTGDSARHDNDEDLPRTQKQVMQQNEFMVSKFAEVFGHKDHKNRPTNDFIIPIVPTFGNNDIMPHNIFLSGPNRWTIKYLDIWRKFIPEVQRHQFQQGGWFSVEVIPGKLAVISLNTIYFFGSNSGVDGCANKREPGYEHMEWLRIQLEYFRERDIKVMLMGHVPPARVDGKESWDETCWQKYTLWVRQFRDIIVGSLYGHMNIDHFMLQDFEQINKDTERGRMASAAIALELEQEMALLEDGEVTVASASDYLINLREAWAQLPSPPAKSSKRSRSKAFDEAEDDEEEEEQSVWDWLVSQVAKGKKDDPDRKNKKRDYLEKIGGKYAERYATSHVAPSVVPNYFPTLRIIEYNISGLEDYQVSTAQTSLPPFDLSSEQLPVDDNEFSDDEAYSREIETVLKHKKKHRGRKKKEPKKYKFRVPDGPSKSAPPGPAYSPQPLTWTRYVQYFANLTHINNDFVDSQHGLLRTVGTKVSNNEDSPHTIFGLQISRDGQLKHNGWKEGKHGKHQGKRPKEEPHPKEFVFEVEYDTQKDKGFKDLTVRRWVEYARRIGQGGRKKSDIEDIDAVEEDEEEEEEEDVDEEGEDFEIESGKKHKKKHKKHKHKKGKKRASKDWFTFVKRAFVGTMDPEDIEALFEVAAFEDTQEEIIEL
ncbi:hypothetical protein NX059_006813 [Plenodomus lindquistii]|nr:hypothetical protein NX059_006813 [Plenodomus lindquistii]